MRIVAGVDWSDEAFAAVEQIGLLYRPAAPCSWCADHPINDAYADGHDRHPLVSPSRQTLV